MQASHIEKNHRTMSILNRTLFILVIYTIFLVCTIPFGVYYVTNNLSDINQSTIDLDDLRLDVDLINSYFIRQAKDRKKLLLRGHNPKDLDKYLKRVKKMTIKIEESTRKVLQNSLAAPYRADL
ncbi:hypothetical protein C2W62_41360 [Candidatus Entotheonella serta]|nr:hypothetical protein C2W62_41360 [Candidatus Entotheonella serta]